jgi:nudix-type nucleoside diphosphatase (YffH/AdpP family)
MPPRPWKTISSRDVYHNKWITVTEDIAELPNGHQTAYTICKMGIAVGVLPFLDENTVVLIRQYRYAQQENFRWEIPTGGTNENESLEDAAQRELAEEAGYKAGRLQKISTLYTSKAICQETAHLFLGYDLTEQQLPQDDTEELEVKTFAFDEALRMVKDSEIRDAMSMTAILYAALERASR